MSKSVLISIQPKWCELIANGKKTVEVRKTKPKLETPFKCYIYCTKSKPLIGNYKVHIYFMDEEDFDYYNKNTIFKCNSKVIGEFVCDEILDYKLADVSTDVGVFYYYERYITQKVYDINSLDDCLTDGELLDYGNYKNLYGWHISDMKIYDEPKELSEFNKPCDFNYDCFLCDRAVYDKKVITDISGKITKVNNKFIACDDVITRLPQSWCYVEELE